MDDAQPPEPVVADEDELKRTPEPELPGSAANTGQGPEFGFLETADLDEGGETPPPDTSEDDPPTKFPPLE
jgi:hypothetical protein